MSVPGMMRILIDDDTLRYVMAGGKETDDFIQKPRDAIQSLDQHNYTEEDMIVNFRDIVSHNYKFYLKTKNKESDDEHPGWEYLRQQFANPMTKYLKYMTISWILAPVLKTWRSMSGILASRSITITLNSLWTMEIREHVKCWMK